jgi:hypothetical protein
MSSCRHHGKNDGSTTSRRENLDKTHNNQSLNPNGVAATNYKGSREVGTHLDAPLLGSNMINGSKAKIQCHNTWTDSRNSTYFCKFRLTQILVVHEVGPIGKIIIFPMSPRTS